MFCTLRAYFVTERAVCAWHTYIVSLKCNNFLVAAAANTVYHHNSRVRTTNASYFLHNVPNDTYHTKKAINFPQQDLNNPQNLTKFLARFSIYTTCKQEVNTVLPLNLVLSPTRQNCFSNSFFFSFFLQVS